MQKKKTKIGKRSYLSFQKALFKRYQISANKRKHSFKLTFYEFTSFLLKNCHYCGAPPSSSNAYKNSNHVFYYNGLDRVFSDEGYHNDNILPCCKICNKMKGTMEFASFITHIELMNEYLHKNKTPDENV